MLARVADRRMVVCAGAGGVGKTTVSASIGLALAARGARVAVVTIDPARRLQTALGMTGLGDEPRRVPAEALRAAGVEPPGELWALQLDAKATFDRLVARHAPDEATRERILENRIYRHLSGAVAGGQEYMAVERLYELMDEGRFDRIVLDTPPARNALDFLDAPERITRFIEGRALRLMLKPATGGWFGARVLQAGSGMILSVLERLTGGQLLRDISDFLAGFEGMYQGFSERAQAVRALLASPEAAFVVVTAPGPEPVREALELLERLRESDLPLAGVVLNRVHPPLPEPPPHAELAAALGRAGAGDAPGLAGRVLVTHAEQVVVARRDGDARAQIAAALGDTPLTCVPALETEPVELTGLAEVAAALR